ncbi:MAG TPA: hypothetical protein VN256_02865 [Pyrinomonadaceae bacterium]|nr:hypothetical protein [Pyrinomonadaceae bacterium]
MSDGNFKKILAAVMFCAAAVFFSSEARAQGRLMPPESVKCDPNHLTSFTGKILSYRRGPGRVSLTVRTDEETTESFTLRFRKSEDAARWFLMRGEPFKRGDWALIERRRYQLRPRMRATVWVCDDGSNPIVDWRPGERGQTTF